MFGIGTKSGHFHYYACATAFRNGRAHCPGRSIPQSIIEALVLEKVRELILREEHLTELVRMTNEELGASLEHLRERLGSLEAQLGDMDRRLGRLHDALETGTLSSDDLAPRIQELRAKRDLLHRAKSEAEETLAAGRVELVSHDVILGYMKDLEGVLENGTMADRRAILKSFDQSIDKADDSASIHSTLPLPREEVLLDR